METKPCSFCGEPILVAAIKCKHCGEFLEAKQVPPPKPDAVQVLHAILFLGVVAGFAWFMMNPCPGDKPQKVADKSASSLEPSYSLTGTNCLIELPSGPIKTPGWEGLVPIAARPGIIPKTIHDLGAIIEQSDRVTTHETEGFSRRVTVNKDRRSGWVPMEWLRCP